MSDIAINLDGLISFLLAGALGLGLLLAISICSLYAWSKSRKAEIDFTAHPAFGHIVGMLSSLACFITVMILIFLRDGGAQPHDLEIWLDEWIWLWGILFLAIWPLGVMVTRKWQRSRVEAGGGF